MLWEEKHHDLVPGLGLIGLSWWLRWYRICLQCRRSEFNPWVGKIPWRREWIVTPVFLPWKIPWTEGPDGLPVPWLQRVRCDWATNTFTFFHLWLTLHLREQDSGPTRSGYWVEVIAMSSKSSFFRSNAMLSIMRWVKHIQMILLAEQTCAVKVKSMSHPGVYSLTW